MISQIKKRDGRIVSFSKDKISRAIFLAAKGVGGSDFETAEGLSDKVVNYVLSKIDNNEIPSVEFVQDCVEKILIKDGHAKTAKAYILHRDKRTRLQSSKI